MLSVHLKNASGVTQRGNTKRHVQELYKTTQAFPLLMKNLKTLISLSIQPFNIEHALHDSHFTFHD